MPSTDAADPTDDPSAAPFHPDARAVARFERIKAIFAKYNLPFEESEWPINPPSQLARVEKQIRMRVRIICHCCRTNYSASKECTNCHHQRCEKCTRIPAKKTRKGKKREQGMRVADRAEITGLPSAARTNLIVSSAVGTGALSSDDAEDEAETPRSARKIVPKKPKRRKEVPLTVPSRTGGLELIRKEPLQRIHRYCCKCHSSFVRDSKACSQCSHLRCTKCPRVPPKLDKWPAGYPGDIIPAEQERPPRKWKKPRVRVRWTCHECRKLFMEREYQCANCSHARCEDCQREPPKRGRTHFSGEAVRSVQDRLATVGTTSERSDRASEPSLVAPSFGEAPETPDAATLRAPE